MELKSQVFLVSCVAKKKTAPIAAKDLYLSAWFRLARQYVEKSDSKWFILSAKYGLVNPNDIIEPYNETLNRKSASDRLAWAQRVQSQMTGQLPDADEIVVLAGARYREYLEPYLRLRFSSVKIPMVGLRIGEQMNWLKNNG